MRRLECAEERKERRKGAGLSKGKGVWWRFCRKKERFCDVSRETMAFQRFVGRGRGGKTGVEGVRSTERGCEGRGWGGGEAKRGDGGVIELLRCVVAV